MERRALIKLAMANLAVACAASQGTSTADGGAGDRPPVDDNPATADVPAPQDAPAVDPDVGAAVSPTSFGVGRVADHPEGVWKLFGARRVIVGRDADGFFAYTASCTHQNSLIGFRSATACTGPTGCTSMSSTGLTECPSHFSRFDANGTVTRGPASSSLRHFRVALVDGEIRVDPAEEVDPDERAATPAR